jgi:outer membrane protein assembly factor BamB
MNRRITAVTIATVIIYLGIIVAWHVYSPNRNIELQNPGADNRPPETARRANEVRIGEFFMRYEESNSQLTGKWTRFRGETASNILQTASGISFTNNDYPTLWEVTTGEGHAAAVIYNGFVYFLDYDENLSSDMLRCFSLETGREQWRRWYRVPMKRNHGFSRTVPFVSGNYIITIGPQGHLMCCDPASGNLMWSRDMQEEFKTEVPFWYAGQCPHVDNDVLVIAPAGQDVLMAGIDCNSGQTLWETPNTPKFKMSHSSVMQMTLHGKSTYVYMGIGGVCGVSAENADRGALLWSVSKWQPSVIAPSPLQLSAGSIFLVAGYGAGGALLQIDRQGSTWTPVIVEQYKANEGLSSEQQTPILYNNMIITVIPKDGGSMRGKLAMYPHNDLHNPVWSSAADERFGLGPYFILNNQLFVFKDDGELYVYQINAKSLQLIKKQRIMEGVDAWGSMAYADGRLILRDAHHIKCLQIN